MQQYFLHLEYESHKCEDLDGALFPDANAAMVEARLALKELAAAAILREGLLPKRIVVDDDRGNRVGVITTRDLLPHRAVDTDLIR